MGALPNPDHERFCQEVHRRVLARESRGAARTAAYREHIYRGETATDEALAPNARRLAQQKHIKERIAELADFAAMLAGFDVDYAMVQLKCDLQELKQLALEEHPRKFSDRVAILRLAADIGGWKAPIKADVTMTLEELIRQSYKADDAKTDPADAP